MSTDEDLYLQARAGNISAFDQLYARYERRLFAFVVKMLGDRADAEEVFHDVFLKVMTGPEARFEQARFVAYLFRSARNACANHHRSAFRGRRAVERLSSGEEEKTVASPEERALDEERASLLARAAARLPEALRDVFSLRTSGLSYEEIADALGIPLGTVKSRMNSLVSQLKGELS